MVPQLIRRCAYLGAALLALTGITACSQSGAPEATAVTPPSATPAATATPTPPPAAKDLGVPKDYDCAGTAIEVIYLEHTAILQLDGESVRLGPVASASGTRYQGWRADGVLIDFWEKGGTAMLNVAGNDYPECSLIQTPVAAATDATSPAETPTAAPAPEVIRTYSARGNEPFWLAQADATEVRWSTADHVAADVFTDLTRTTRADGFDLAATREGGALALSANATVCRDSMTGMPHPDTVVVQVDGREFTGCGGNPIDVLTPNEWTVASIGGAAMSGRPPTLQFSADAQASGFAGCNRWTSSAVLSGEGLRIGMAAATRMACLDDTASKQESDFLAALGRITSFDVDANGDLLLKAGNETVIVAKATAPQG
jgi:heat shock protein HslJ/membrane-bound inhibitor of C-type lysozyme